MKDKVFKFYESSSHGWYAVKRKYIEELGVLNKISECSFQHGGTVYLEEDGDALAFFEAYEKKFGSPPKIDTKDFNSEPSCTRYERFSP